MSRLISVIRRTIKEKYFLVRVWIQLIEFTTHSHSISDPANKEVNAKHWKFQCSTHLSHRDIKLYFETDSSDAHSDSNSNLLNHLRSQISITSRLSFLLTPQNLIVYMPNQVPQTPIYILNRFQSSSEKLHYHHVSQIFVKNLITEIQISEIQITEIYRQ